MCNRIFNGSYFSFLFLKILPEFDGSLYTSLVKSWLKRYNKNNVQFFYTEKEDEISRKVKKKESAKDLGAVPKGIAAKRKPNIGGEAREFL